MRAGVAIIDITPPAGLAMCGFGARIAPAEGTHDPLTVRAVAIDDTAIVCADVIGLHEDSSARIRAACTLAEDRVVVAASHTHGGPAAMPGRLGGQVDPTFLECLEAACVAAIDAAVARQVPATMLLGYGADPDVGRNRRHSGGPTDPALPVLRLVGAEGADIAVIVSYACHPVVLGPDNLLWTADYPGSLRDRIEQRHPGAVALFLTGCCGEINTGHRVRASQMAASDPARTFPAAAAIGGRIAEAAARAGAADITGACRAATATIALPLTRNEPGSLDALAASSRAEMAGATPAWRETLRLWADWADGPARLPAAPWPARVTVLGWGGVRIVALPGEVFATTARTIRAAIGGDVVTIGYAEGNPGYIPPANEYAHGGYEVAEAHRFYGMPAAFAPGAAELLADAAVALARGI